MIRVSCRVTYLKATTRAMARAVSWVRLSTVDFLVKSSSKNYKKIIIWSI